MGKLIKRQNLTESQYLRSNRVMCMILLISYLTYTIVEIMNAKTGMQPDAILRCSVYGVSALVSIIMTLARPRKKASAVIMAVMYLISFPVLVFGNGVVVLAMVFPVIIGFMIYLNSMLVGLGCVSALIIGAIKCLLIRSDPVLFNYGIMLMAGYVVASVGAMSVIILLINFSREDRAVIEQAAEHRAKVAKVVADIVASLYADFTEMVHSLNTVNDAMRSADDAMDGIAGSSADTANAVNNQAKMTTHIQENLEHTDSLATEAGDTTEELKTVVTEGRALADSLLEQSNVVDHGVELISEVMDRLMHNVQRVTGITNTIMSISSQTNLLALNASVEAARAGEAGRGFSVIAGEIRSMSAETEESTGKIEAIISELITLTNDIQTAIHDAAENIALQRRQVGQVNESFQNIQTGMLALQSRIVTMSENVKSVLTANGEIVDSIGLLSAASEETSAGMQVCKQTTNTAFENLGRFSRKVNGAFGQLQHLKETAGS